MGMGFAPTWLRQVSPLLHKTTLTTAREQNKGLGGVSKLEAVGFTTGNILLKCSGFLFPVTTDINDTKPQIKMRSTASNFRMGKR